MRPGLSVTSTLRGQEWPGEGGLFVRGHFVHGFLARKFLPGAFRTWTFRTQINFISLSGFAKQEAFYQGGYSGDIMQIHSEGKKHILNTCRRPIGSTRPIARISDLQLNLRFTSEISIREYVREETQAEYIKNLKPKWGLGKIPAEQGDYVKYLQ